MSGKYTSQYVHVLHSGVGHVISHGRSPRVTVTPLLIEET